MKHKTDAQKIKVADAWYKLLYNVAYKSSIEITRNMDLTKQEADKFRTILNKIDNLGDMIGFVNSDVDVGALDEILDFLNSCHDQIINDAFKATKDKFEIDLEKQTEEMRTHMNRGAK